jgi:AmiR/NasT family two-component response regulator
MPEQREIRHLRVLIANERRDRLELLAQVVAGLGHEVIAREIYVKEVGAVTARERPDVALVGLGLSSEHALELISEIVREASCAVIALLSAKDAAYVREAAKRGVFAYIVDGNPDELQSAIEITLQRFSEYQSLQGAFGRRALIEQAKGILISSTLPRRSSTVICCCFRRSDPLSVPRRRRSTASARSGSAPRSESRVTLRAAPQR